mmetsp:Transcript_28890/g.86734  ORF Transcript_28890/g.86734 Transcript_28890/m.86734 type:complete len:226 (-) Transcript_28890:479-1156(-)
MSVTLFTQSSASNHCTSGSLEALCPANSTNPVMVARIVSSPTVDRRLCGAVASNKVKPLNEASPVTLKRSTPIVAVTFPRPYGSVVFATSASWKLTFAVVRPERLIEENGSANSISLSRPAAPSSVLAIYFKNVTKGVRWRSRASPMSAGVTVGAGVTGPIHSSSAFDRFLSPLPSSSSATSCSALHTVSLTMRWMFASRRSTIPFSKRFAFGPNDVLSTALASQ